MTIFFPDVSSYTPNVDPSKYPVIIARATLSTSVVDKAYPTFKAKAAAAGAVFAAYHWLNHGNLSAQARHCYSVVGPGIPVMIDAEDKAGNTGYNGPLTVDDITGFAAAYRALGGICSLSYVPFWYWSGAMGAPYRLAELTDAGLGLVSSNYPNAGYTEGGPGWASYGGATPVQWQYTSTPIDMNAYRGTVAEYARLIGADMANLGYTDDDGKYLCERERALMFLDQATMGPEQGTTFPAVEALKRIDEGVKTLASRPVDPAAVAAALTTDQLAAAITAAGITPEAVAGALAQHFHVS